MVREHGAEHPSQWAAIASIAGKLGCTNFLQAERARAHVHLTFPVIRGIVQEIFSAFLFAQRPHCLKRIEALRSVQLRI